MDRSPGPARCGGLIGWLRLPDQEGRVTIGGDLKGSRQQRRLVALLRGSNVGEKNSLPMKDLRGIFVEAGCEDARAYVQNGNVVFRASPSIFAELSCLIATRIAERFGSRTPVVLRTAGQFCNVVLNNPFLAVGEDEQMLYVISLADQPGAERVAALDLRSPCGVAESKLTDDYLDSTLATMTTARNWRTVTKLLDLL